MTGVSTASLECLPWPVSSQVAVLISADDYVLPGLGSWHIWPDVLHGAITTLFNASAPMLLLWGEHGLLLFNDAFAHLHPEAWPLLGSPAQQLLTAEALGHLTRVYQSGSAQVVTTSVVRQEGWADSSYSLSMVPVLQACMPVGGVLGILSENNNDWQIGDRRLKTLEQAAECFERVTTRAQLVKELGLVLKDNPEDVLGAALYCPGETQKFELFTTFDMPAEQGFLQRLGQRLQHLQCGLSELWQVATPGFLDLDVLLPETPVSDTGGPLPQLVLLALQGGAEKPVAGFLLLACRVANENRTSYLRFARALASQLSLCLTRLFASPSYLLDSYLDHGGEADIASRALFSSREISWLQRFFEHAPSGICVVYGPHHVVEWSNRSFARFFGASLKGQAVDIALPEMSQQGLLNSLARVCREAKPYLEQNVMLSFNSASGLGMQRVYLDFAYQPIVSAKGFVLGVVIIATDVSKQVYAEQELIDLNEHFERRLVERTHTLSEGLSQFKKENQQQQLGRHAQKMDALTHLTGGIAHDYNNLLTGVIGSLEMAQWQLSKPGGQAVGKYLERALSSAQKGADLTRRLMMFSRTQRFTPTVLNLEQALSSMSELLSSHCGENIQVQIEVDPAIWTVSCDLHQLENALLNLVLNASDAMPDGGEVLIRAFNQPIAKAQHGLAAKDYVCLQVVDSGFGMSAQTLEHAFEPFFTTKGVGKGTGLGLAMVYSFAQEAQGTVKLSSTLGLGTQVRLYLPRFDALISSSTGPVVVAPTVIPLVQHYRVMVVEDQSNVRRLVVDVLEELGCEVLQAENADQALEHLDTRGRCDLLITDIGLPGMSGRELVKQARVLLPELKVVFMTGYAVEGDGLADAAATGLLAKPFSVGQLRHQVKQMLAV